MQQYFFRNSELRHLRVAQFFRYFALAEDEEGKKDAPLRTVEDTCDAADDSVVERALWNRNYDHFCEDLPVGSQLPPWRRVALAVARRRRNHRLGVSRSRVLEPLGPQREAFYEQRLLFALPWFCDSLPEPVGTDGSQR